VRVLLLGGTSEARTLAAALADRDMEVISSLAGRVSSPTLPVGPVRIGGFGGVDGLAGYLRTERIGVLVDATHPFAATITRHAVAAGLRTATPILILRRPGWTAGPGDRWSRVPDMFEAATDVAAASVERVFLTTGRRDLAVFAADDRHEFLVRTVDPPQPPTPPRMTLVLDRGPYTVESETALMRRHDVQLLVTKDSGGEMTTAKLTAARVLGVPVIVVDRPPPPRDADVLDTVEAVLARLDQLPG